MATKPDTDSTPRLPAAAWLGIDPQELRLLLEGEHPEPHRILGPHAVLQDGREFLVLRAFHPEAAGVECQLDDGTRLALQPLGKGGLFGAVLPETGAFPRYRLRFQFGHGWIWEREDPYRFRPTLGPMDLHLFNEGTHHRLWEKLGAHPTRLDGVDGVAFAVWAPNAQRVSVVGDFCRWDARLYPMRRLGVSGVFELFVPGVQPGALYKFEIKSRAGQAKLKADPFAFSMETPPGTRSRVVSSSYVWGDAAWLEKRASAKPTAEPMSIYEVHLGSWARLLEEGNRPLTYREIAQRLVEHVQNLGFTHLELLPVSEHPFYGSWGYQVTGYFAPTSRYGTPDDFRAFVDTCHQAGLGVILDWVPAHFPKDDFALRRFDGSALYEHADPRLGEHPDWGTLIFNYGRKEVKNFLVANALYWMEEFHIDGLRVDAVASMLYLDYGREPGQWLPNRLGGRENLEAVEFLQDLNEAIHLEYPGCFTVAEESTSWPGVTHPVSEGGLGFTFKWNMGWMNDTLRYFKLDPADRGDAQKLLTFGILYEWTERFVMPLSHDEVVHLKKSLLEKMPGDRWRKFANLRLLMAYLYLRPGKKLLFMGTELAPHREWNHDTSLDWHLANEPYRVGLASFLAELGKLYLQSPSLWRQDGSPAGFSWIDCEDTQNSVISFIRADGDDFLIAALNFTPRPQPAYRIGAPEPGKYIQRLSSDGRAFGGSDYPSPLEIQTEPIAYHRRAQSMLLHLPPLGALVLELSPEGKAALAERRRAEREAIALAELEAMAPTPPQKRPLRLIAMEPQPKPAPAKSGAPAFKAPPQSPPPQKQRLRLIDLGEHRRN